MTRPHVVLLSLDTLRADRLRAYEASARPHPALDRLSHRGHTFARAYSTAPWTLPAHVSLFTGLYSDRHGVVDSRYAIGDSPSFVEALRAQGYETVGFTGGGFVGPQYGFTRGFSIYDGWRDGQNPVPASALPREGKRPMDAKSNVFDRASAFLEARRNSRPLFLFVHTYAVHDYFREWQPDSTGKTLEPTDESRAKLDCLLGRSQCTTDRWRELESAYDDGVDDVDRALGSLLELIDSELDLKRTILIVLSDHGEGFDPARGRIHHGGRLHRDQLHVPLIVAGPGIAGGRSDAPVSLVDIGPTILELIGAKADADLDGRSLLPTLFGERRQDPRRAVVASEYAYYWENGRREHVAEAPTRPLLTARIDDEQWSIAESDRYEVFAVDDPAQTSPLPADAYDPAPDGRSARKPGKPARVQETMEVIEQLRALGYIQ